MTEADGGGEEFKVDVGGDEELELDEEDADEELELDEEDADEAHCSKVPCNDEGAGGDEDEGNTAEEGKGGGCTRADKYSTGVLFL